MTKKQLIEKIRSAAKAGQTMIDATLAEPIRGVKHVVLNNLDGSLNGNPNDIWVSSRSLYKTLGRIYLGSRRVKANTEGWEKFISTIDN